MTRNHYLSKLYRKIGILLLGLLSSLPLGAADYQEDLPNNVTRQWLGPELWTANNRFHQDNWRLHDGRIECTDDSDGNQVHLLTYQLAEGDGDLEMSVRTGALRHRGEGYVGFRFAVTGQEDEYRANMHWMGGENGIAVGLNHEGALIIGEHVSDEKLPESYLEDVILRMRAVFTGNHAEVTLRAFDPANPEGEPLAEMVETVAKSPMVGNLTLICHDRLANWFDNWKVSGSKVEYRPDQRYGPIFWTQYTVDDNILKMSAFMPPLDREVDTQTIALEIQENDGWKQIAEANIDPNGTPSGEWSYKNHPFALFRVEDWDDSKDVPYRVVYDYQTGNGTTTDIWSGTIRRNPVDQPVLRLGTTTCVAMHVFPSHHLEDNMIAHDPDILFFSGDNVYGQSYVYFGWTFRNLLKDRPSICTPDDHDVAEDDLWGRGGELRPDGADRLWGGYGKSVEDVNGMHLLQTAHLPDPYNPDAGKNDIHVYFTDLTYGGVSFGIIDDRHFKSAPIEAFEHLMEVWNEDDIGAARNTMRRMDREQFDPQLVDNPEYQLLGEEQLIFLEDWAADWRHADLKILLHQSPFCQSANYGGGAWPPDLDVNGWPQTGRNRALRTIRKAFAPTISGDTHLGMLMQQGVEEFGDAAWQYVSPAGVPTSNRNWNPGYPGENHEPGMPDYTGDYIDAFGNMMTVWAVYNPRSDFSKTYREQDGSQVDFLQERVAGYGIIDLDKENQTYTFNSYPVYGQGTPVEEFEQSPGWPRTVPMADNFGATPKGYLPEIALNGERPVVQVIDSSGEVVYTRRVAGETFQPPVFELGQYRVLIGHPETGEVEERVVSAVPADR